MADTFAWIPEFGGQVDTAPRLREASLGDGYTQSVPDGINNMPLVRSLTFASRDSAEIDAIDTFLRNQGGAKWFWYTHPGKAAIKVKCKKWSAVEVAANLETLSCVFEQVFNPGA